MQKTVINNAKLKESIPYGGLKTIAEKSKTSIYTVSRVVNGKSKNLAVKTAIAEYLTGIVETDNKINDLVSNQQPA